MDQRFTRGLLELLGYQEQQHEIIYDDQRRDFRVVAVNGGVVADCFVASSPKYRGSRIPTESWGSGVGEGFRADILENVRQEPKPDTIIGSAPMEHMMKVATELGGRSILITGAAGGIGVACAKRLGAAGARLLLADLDGHAAERLASELGPDHMPIQADVTSSADIRRMVDAAYDRWGRLDVLFNNAGIIQGKPLLDITETDWDRILDVNLRAVFFVLQAVARRMTRQDPIPGSELRGKLIQMASIAAYRGGFPIMCHYAASKAGVISVTRTAAQALAPYKVTSNAICPGAVDTPMWARLDADWSASEGWDRGEAWRRRTAMIPLGRPETPDDVAGPVVFLAGPSSDYITGQAINVDGGVILGN